MTKSIAIPLSSALSVALLLCGCDLFGPGASGGGAACGTTFQWAGCPTGNWCESTTPLAMGSKGQLRTAEGCAWTAVSTSSPSVATIKLTAMDEVEVTAVGPGTVNLLLTGAIGTKMVPITIATPDHLVADGNFSATQPIAMLGNSALRFHAYGSAGGQALAGQGNVMYAASGTLRLATDSDPSGGVVFTGTAGSGSLSATLGTTNLTIPVAIADDTQVTNVAIQPMQQTDAYGNAALQLDVTVYSGSTPLYVSPCTWDISSGALFLASTDGGTLATSPTTRYVFSGSPGSFILSCTIAGQPREFMVQL